jgi:membrane associated rhomboid family serine protease
MCPGCRALLGPEDAACPYCGWNVRQTEVRREGGFVDRALRPFGGLIPVLVFANVAVYVAGAILETRLRDPDDPAGQGVGGLLGALANPALGLLVFLGANVPDRVVERGEVWRLLACTLLHGGWWHILFNMMVLRDVGRHVEEAYGAGKTFALYTLAGIAGSAATLGWWWFETGGRGRSPVAIGASGAILGLAGMLLGIGFRVGGEPGKRIWKPLLKWIVLIFALGFVLNRFTAIRIDNSAHAGGFLLGLAAGWFGAFGVRARGNPTAVAAWDAVAVLAVLLSVASFAPPVAALLRGG